jgi:hypothetical protein
MMVIMASVKRMIKSILNYLLYSEIVIQLTLNPIWWRFKFQYANNPTGLDYKMHYVGIRILMLKIEFIIDDGSW